MAGFRRVGDGVAARFARPESAIIRDLVEQVVELVEPSDGPDRGISVSEADELARMVGMGDDPEAANEFRRFTESGLRSGKVSSAMTLLETLPPGGGRIKLTADQAEAWLRSLNDVR